MDELFIGCRNSDGIKNFVKSTFVSGYFPSFGNFTRYGMALQDCADECNKVTSCWAFRHDVYGQWSVSMNAMISVCHGYYNKEPPAKIISSKNNEKNQGDVAYVKCINGRYITFLYEMFRGIVLLMLCTYYPHLIL